MKSILALVICALLCAITSAQFAARGRFSGTCGVAQQVSIYALAPGAVYMSDCEENVNPGTIRSAKTVCSPISPTQIQNHMYSCDSSPDGFFAPYSFCVNTNAPNPTFRSHFTQCFWGRVVPAVFVAGTPIVRANIQFSGHNCQQSRLSSITLFNANEVSCTPAAPSMSACTNVDSTGNSYMNLCADPRAVLSLVGFSIDVQQPLPTQSPTAVAAPVTQAPTPAPPTSGSCILTLKPEARVDSHGMGYSFAYCFDFKSTANCYVDAAYVKVTAPGRLPAFVPSFFEKYNGDVYKMTFKTPIGTPYRGEDGSVSYPDNWYTCVSAPSCQSSECSRADATEYTLVGYECNGCGLRSGNIPSPTSAATPSPATPVPATPVPASPSPPSGFCSSVTITAVTDNSWSSNGVLHQIISLHVSNTGNLPVSAVTLSVDTDGAISGDAWNLNRVSGGTYQLALYGNKIASHGSFNTAGFELYGASRITVTATNVQC